MLGFLGGLGEEAKNLIQHCLWKNEYHVLMEEKLEGMRMFEEIYFGNNLVVAHPQMDFHPMFGKAAVHSVHLRSYFPWQLAIFFDP